MGHPGSNRFDMLPETNEYDSLRHSIALTLKEHYSLHLKHSAGLILVNILNGVIFFTSDDFAWVRPLLAAFGVMLGIFWSCINWPPRGTVYDDASLLLSENQLHTEWGLVILSHILNMVLGVLMAAAWCWIFISYVFPYSISSARSMCCTFVGLLLIVAFLPICRKAFEADSIFMLECDEALRPLYSEQQKTAFTIVCNRCGEKYHTTGSNPPKNLCKQCYLVDRYLAESWLGVFTLGLLIWSIALRQIAFNLISDVLWRYTVWGGLFLLSSLCWWPLVRWNRLAFWGAFFHSGRRRSR